MDTEIYANLTKEKGDASFLTVIDLTDASTGRSLPVQTIQEFKHSLCHTCPLFLNEGGCGLRPSSQIVSDMRVERIVEEGKCTNILTDALLGYEQHQKQIAKKQNNQSSLNVEARRIGNKALAFGALPVLIGVLSMFALSEFSPLKADKSSFSSSVAIQLGANMARVLLLAIYSEVHVIASMYDSFKKSEEVRSETYELLKMKDQILLTIAGIIAVAGTINLTR